MSFTMEREIDLSKHGWDGCSLKFLDPSYKEITDWQKKIQTIDKNDPASETEVMDFVLSKFVSGNGMENGKKVPVTKDNFLELPGHIVMDIVYLFISGNVDSNL